MYKYLLFGFDDYYPSGGMNDLVIKFNTFEQFENEFEFFNCDNWQLVDLNTFITHEFNTAITHHIGVDDFKGIRKKREIELKEWVISKLTK